MVLDVDQEQMTNLGFCGVEGLKLSSLTMVTSLSTTGSPSVVGFNVSATLAFRDFVFDLEGYYSKSDWGLKAEVIDFDFSNLRDMYHDLFGADLHISDHEILLDDLTFFAGSSGLSFATSVTIEGFTCVAATISISRLGVAIAGEVDDITIDGDIVLKRATLDVFIGRSTDTTISGPGTSFKFAITGVVAIGSIQVSASLLLDKTANGDLLWTILGSVDEALSLSSIAPALKGTFLDLSLQQVALIASNVDNASARGALVPSAYQIVKGVQIAATLGSVPAIDGALDRKAAPTKGLTLSAIYDVSQKSFELAIRLAVPQSMAMKSSTVYSGPISLLIKEATPLPMIAVTADFFVRVPDQDPLKFTGGLSLSFDEAKLLIELKDQWSVTCFETHSRPVLTLLLLPNRWHNPFGLSQSLSLGPDLALQIGIVYVSPIYPSELGVAAGLAVGSVSGKAALSISDSPHDELIMMEIVNLGIRDVVKFASTVFEIDMPLPDDFLHFKQVSFYLSTGTTIGTKLYPPGASFSCDAVIFGVEAKIFCGINKPQKQIQVSGSLDPITLGPISVGGTETGTPARLDVQIGPVAQSVLIDGVAQFLDMVVKIKVNAMLLPTTAFDLSTELQFTAHLTFTLEAHMRGTFQNVNSLDFNVFASMHQVRTLMGETPIVQDITLTL